MDFGICDLPIIRDFSICNGVKSAASKPKDKRAKAKAKVKRSAWDVLVHGGKTVPLSHYASSALGLGCVSDTSSDACDSSRNPTFDPPFFDTSIINEKKMIFHGTLVPFGIRAAKCDGETSNLRVTLKAGNDSHRMTDPDNDGIFTVTVPADYWGSWLQFVIEDIDRGTSVTHDFWGFPTVIAPPGNACDSWPDPDLTVGEVLFREPTGDVSVGEQNIFYYPRVNTVRCDKKTGLDEIKAEEEKCLQVYFTVSPPGCRFKSKPDDPQYYYINHIFNTTGEKVIVMDVTDTCHGGGPVYAQAKIDYVKSEDDTTCYSITGPDSLGPNPNISIVKGDNTPFNWREIFTDCNGEPLRLVEQNVNEYLHGYTSDMDDIDYDGYILNITGQVMPSRNGGASRVVFQDDYGNTKILYLHLPPIKRLEIKHVTPDNFIQLDKEVAFFLLREPSGTTNFKYRFVTTAPDGSETRVEQGDAYFPYTPAQTGLHILNLEVSAYNGEVISADPHPFVANDAPSGPVCYENIPNPGRRSHTPDISQIVRGDNTFFTWTIEGLTDGCLLGPLTLYSHNVSDILYDLNNESVSYDPDTYALTISGRIRSDIDGGSAMQFAFFDDWGHAKVINEYPVPPLDPKIKIYDFWITVSESVTLELLTEPNGVTYRYHITRPDGTQVSSSSLSSSVYTLPAGQKSLIGTYQVDLEITADDGYTFTVPGSFSVNED